MHSLVTDFSRREEPHSVPPAVLEMLRQASPGEVLRFAAAAFGPDTALACSFGPEDMLLLDAAWRAGGSLTVFSLDTGLFFPETLALVRLAAARYPLPFLQVEADLSLQEQEARYGASLWERDPSACCTLRKVEPLRSFLCDRPAWITGIRRSQSPTRAQAEVLEWDAAFGLWKVNPLAFWEQDAVWTYLRDFGVPTNPLHDRGYPSIGCAPCTRPVAPGEEERAGRWPGREKTECGLHVRGG